MNRTALTGLSMALALMVPVRESKHRDGYQLPMASKAVRKARKRKNQMCKQSKRRNRK